MSIIRSSITISIITFLSRILGFVRDILIASRLGSGVLSDVFFVALKLPNSFRSIFAEGAFNQAFIPIFSGILAKEGEKGAILFAKQILAFTIIILFLLLILAHIFMPEIMAILAPGFAGEPDKFALVVSLSRITFPYLLLISIATLFIGVLNSFNKFGVAAFTQIIYNIVIISALLLLASFTSNHAYSLAIGVLIAGVAQILWLVFNLVKKKIFFIPAMPKITDETRQMGRKTIPAIIGFSVMQINSWVDTIFASLFAGAVSYFYYAERLIQFPLALIGTALGIALLPTLSKQIKSDNITAARASLSRALEFGILLTIPAATALLVLSYPIILTLFERGEFSNFDTLQTAQILLISSFALPAFVLVKIFTPAIFASGDTKTPMKIAIICLFVNIILNFVFIKIMGFLGIMVATVIASWVNLLLLMIVVIRRKLFEFSRKLLLNFTKIVIASLVMAGILLLLRFYIDEYLNLGLYVKALIMAMLVGVGIITFMVSGLLLRVTIIIEIIRKGRKFSPPTHTSN